MSVEIYASSPRRDLQGGVVWTALGCLIVVLSWQMDRMTQQGATLHTAPGLWPGIVGTLLAALGGVLVLRSWRRARRIGWDAAETDDTAYAPLSSFGLATTMFFVYALLLVGRGLPFWLGTAMFVTLFVFLFQYTQRKAAGRMVRGFVVALACGVLTAAIVTLAVRAVVLRAAALARRGAGRTRPMFDGLIAFGHSIWSFCDPLSLGLILLSSLVGVIIGALPGLTATMGVALMTTLTIKMPSNQALLVLICTYVGAIYGGSRSAILLNIPGTPASAASCLDGHALAKQGLAGRAMGIATSGSVLGTLIGMFFLALFTPILGNLALKFGAYEFFWLALFGVIIAGTLTGDDPLKGWIAGLIGIFTAAIGQEAIYAYDRFTFGSRDLAGGFQLVPALVGAFGFAELLMAVREKPAPVKINPFDSVIPKLKDVTQYWRTILRSGVIGTFIGILPGVGEDVAAWSSYAAAKRVSKEKALFGKGSIDGLMAAETGDNACVPGAVIPVLTLAVPGSAPAAVLMAAMLIHGVRPGPMIMIEAPTFVYDVVAMMMFATIGILIYGLTLTKLLIKVLMVPKPIILPIIFVLCVVGSYAISQRLFDVWVMLGFGVLGYALRRLKYPVAPLVLGMVLGDLMEKGFRRGLVLSDGELLPFFTRPISAALWITIAVVIAFKIPGVGDRLGRLFTRRTKPAAG